MSNLGWSEIAAVLAVHQRHGVGQTGRTPDKCACGERVPPAPPTDEMDIMERRDLAMARHQLDELQKAVMA